MLAAALHTPLFASELYLYKEEPPQFGSTPGTGVPVPPVSKLQV